MDYVAVHKKWRAYWEKNNTDKFDAGSKKPPYYCLTMLPYPSGATLHIGHFFQYCMPDTHSRFKRMCGFNVFQPMGFDAFGLPAENHAFKTNTHPYDNTVKNMALMREQFASLGAMYPWEYSITTCFPDYYKWNQWLFLQLYKAGLAYQKEAPVNWCDKCKTVLANEQVVGGECERCSTTVVRRNMKQWFLKITDYAEQLLTGLDGLDWAGKTIAMQKNWIGKSVGQKIKFDDLEVFTTRPDTIYGATFMVIAPEHVLAQKYITKEHAKKCAEYIAETAKKSEIERQSDDRQKTGVFTGGYVKNPATGEQIPVWLADYVIASYGTGAIMAVPAYDERDRAFAEKYKLPIVKSKLTDKKFGKDAVTYRLRDWSIGRQRYWGTPIPIIYCDHCGTVPVPENDLPVVLPHIADFKPKGDSPLAAHPEFYNCTCPVCGKPAKRECDTMDTFVCSSWYYLRYPYANRADIPFDKNVRRPDVYIGGTEHSCGHLLYSRFINRFLYEKGFVKNAEPFPKLIHQGLILAADGSKMSKSKNNFVVPDDYTNKYGSDILRLFLQFGFNFSDGGPWDEGVLKTITRFTERIETVINRCGKGAGKPDEALLHTQAKTIKAVRNDLENFSFNTAVARCMEFLNAIEKSCANGVNCADAVKNLVLLVAPMIPHIGEEFWEMVGGKSSVFDQKFPTYDEKYLTAKTVEIAVQINSKIVGRITVAGDAPQPDAEKLCAEFIAGKTVKKVIYIPNRIINFIAG